MPFPFLIGAAVVLCGTAAVGGHLSAKEKNEKAQNIVEKAKKKYEKTKLNLETKQNDVNAAFVSLMQNKKVILNTVLQRFANTYKKVKDFKLKDSTGISEIDKMQFGISELEELKKLSIVYKEADDSIDDSNIAMALGAAAGPAVAGFMGSSFIAATLTSPLAVVGAPLFLFSAFKADAKADENLEKAETYSKETSVSVKKMKASITLCDAVKTKVSMFESLLLNLQKLLVVYEKNMTDIVNKNEKKFKRVNQADFSNDDLSVIAATRSIAKAVKIVIDTPIIDNEWRLTPESEVNYDIGEKVMLQYSEQQS